MNQSLPSIFPLRNTKQGIALVIVLGFLSVLTLLAIAFAVSMRTERTAASNYLDVVKAKYMTHAAVARAISEVDTLLTGQDAVYLSWTNVYTSLSLGTPAPVNDPVLFSGDAFKYFPTVSSNELDQTSTEPEWTDVFDPEDGTSIIGRVAFHIVDASGLLDANVICEIPRTNGISPREIGFDPLFLEEFATPASVESFVSNRNDRWIRFENVADLYAMAGHDSGSPMSNFPSILGTFNYSKNQYLAGSVSVGQGRDKILLSPSTGSLSNDLVDAFTAASIPGDAGHFAANVLAYLDADDDLDFGQWDTYVTERNPLINEVVVTHQYFTPDSGVSGTMNLDMSVELVFPFDGADQPRDYELEYTFVPLNAPFPLAPPGYANQTVVLPGPWSEGDIRVVTIPRLGYTGLPWLTNTAAFAGFNGRFILRLRAGAVEIDQIGNDASVAFTNDLSRIGTVIQSDGFAVDDPRLNHLPTSWTATSSAIGPPPTMGAWNTGIATHNAPGADGGYTNFYVRNGPMESVGELGHIFYDETKPWHTIRLLSPDPDNTATIMDRFTVSTNNSFRGKVNLNTPYTNVMGAVLHRCPVGHYPDDPTAVRLPSNEVYQVIQSIVNRFRGTGNDAKNLSDISRIDESDLTTLASIQDGVQAESVIRNTLGLLTTSGTTYMGIVAGQSIKDRDGVVTDEDIRSENRAFVIFWRDPYPDSTGEHPTIIRFFKWLDDWETTTSPW